MKNSKKQLTLALALVTVGSVTVAQAQIINIPVPNNDFSANGTYVIEDASPNAVPGYTFTNQGVDAYGVLTNALTAPSVVSDPNVPGSAQAGFMNTLGTNVSTLTTATLSTLIAANTTYTFSIDIGNPTGTGRFANPGNISFGLLAGGTATGTFKAVPTGTIGENSDGTSALYETFSFSFTTGATGGFIGQDLEAEVIDQAPGFESQTYFNNLQLTSEVVAAPEPSTYAMLLGGIAVLFGRLRLRKRA